MTIDAEFNMTMKYVHVLTINLLLGITFLGLSSTALAAEILLRAPTEINAISYIAIVGEIKAGDAKQFEEILQKASPLIVVNLYSPGGDLIEAMNIAALVREKFLITSAPDSLSCRTIQLDFPGWDWWPKNQPKELACTCNSACMAIWVAGVHRGGGSTYDVLENFDSREAGIGIHRPYFDKNYFSSLPADEAETEYRRLTDLYFKFLAEMGTPESIIEETLAIPSDEIRFLQEAELERIRGYIPAIDEWLKAHCEVFSTEESNELFDLWEKGRNRELSNAERFYVEHLETKEEASRKCIRGLLIKEQRARLNVQ